MNNQSEQTGCILFNNKLYRKRSVSKALLCLRPDCKANRLCSAQHTENGLIVHQDHHACKGWIQSIRQLTKWDQSKDSLQLGSNLSTDYLENPIESIFKMKAFGSARWEDQLFSYFQQIKASIEEELSKIYIKCQRDINLHLEVNQRVHQRIQMLCRSMSSKWEENNQVFYQSFLQEDLKLLHKTGLLKLSNNQLLSKSYSLILQQLSTIEYCIWNKEPEYDFLQRLAFKTQKQELVNFKMDSNVQDIGNKINAISGSLKTSIKYIEEERVMNTVCFLCSKTFYSTAFNSKLRKQQCRSSLFDHLLQQHIDEVANKFTIKWPIKLSLQELRRQIIAKNAKKVIVVDKENMGFFNSEAISQYTDYYCVQVLSKNNEQIAKIRYLVAESKGKDAADILIIIVLWQLSKLKLQEIILLTKDHYGETLQPIFSSLGVNITILDNLEPSSLRTHESDSSIEEIQLD